MKLRSLLIRTVADTTGRENGMRILALFLFVALWLAVGSSPVVAQSWKWTYDGIDASARFTSVAVDAEGNVHVAYAGEGGSVLKYAYRAAGTKRWFTMVLDKQLQEFATNITVDPQGNPQICYTPRELRYAQFDGKTWKIQQIAPGSGSIEYNCTITVGADSTPHVIWYHTRTSDGSNFLHLKYASLRDGAWLAKTVDFEGEDGKWNSMVLDSDGYPQLVYSVFPRGELKYATWTGSAWALHPGIIPENSAAAGMGNSLVLDARNGAQVSFYETSVQYAAASTGSLKFARRKGNNWQVETVDSVVQRGSWVGFRSSLVLDSHGSPHICYEDGGTLKHAFSEGGSWHIEVVAPRSNEPYLYSSMAITKNDDLYISYRDPSDGSLKVAAGHKTVSETSTALQQDKKD